ncbi:MAG: hypothetical protein SFU25_04375 [Candidatus Caenarcaniphilales bacterium]|nr:hypothetical protein [Candidatus Caenarcaniphilales bacterium]
MSNDKIADSQKKLELATNIVVAFINASKSSDKSEKSTTKTAESSASISEGQILDLLEKTFNKMHDLVPFQERKMGLGR